MASTNFGTYHLADNPKSYQPIRTNNFRFLVSGLDRLLRVAGDANDANDYITNGQEVIDFSVVSFTVPDFQQQPIEINRGNWVDGFCHLVAGQFLGLTGVFRVDVVLDSDTNPKGEQPHNRRREDGPEMDLIFGCDVDSMSGVIT